jgi:hypothetical protein
MDKEKLNDLRDAGLGCLIYIGGVLFTIWILENVLTLLFGQA